MRFKDFYYKQPEWEWFSFDAAGVLVHIIFDNKESVCTLNEAKHNGIPLTGQYSAQVHGPHGYGQKHLHAYAKNNQLFAINWDGTAQDQSHGIPIPNKFAKAITQRFPDLHLPTNNFIESVMPDMLDVGKLKLLLE